MVLNARKLAIWSRYWNEEICRIKLSFCCQLLSGLSSYNFYCNFCFVSLSLIVLERVLEWFHFFIKSWGAWRFYTSWSWRIMVIMNWGVLIVSVNELWLGFQIMKHSFECLDIEYLLSFEVKLSGGLLLTIILHSILFRVMNEEVFLEDSYKVMWQLL